MRAPAEQGDLRDHAAGLRDAGKDDVPVLRRDMRFQRAGRLPAPHLHRFGDHGERIDDLRVARHGIEVEVRAAEIAVRLRELPRRELLVQIGDDEEHCAAGHNDETEMWMHQIDHDDEERHQRCIEKGDERARGQEGPQLLQILQRLVVPAVAVQRCASGGTQDRRPELHFELDRRAHQDEAPDRIHEGLQDDGAQNGNREHDQRIDRTARQHAVGYLEEIERDRKQQHVDGDREGHDDDHVAPDSCDTPCKTNGKVHRFAALVEAGAATAATATTAKIGGFAVVAAVVALAALVLPDWPAIAVDRLAEGNCGIGLCLALISRRLERHDGRVRRCLGNGLPGLRLFGRLLRTWDGSRA